MKIRMGMLGPKAMPLVLGADCSGVVDAIGEGVLGFAPGDEVYAMAYGPCSNGSYAQYLCLPEEFVCQKPKSLSFEEASGIPLVAMTAYRSMVSSGALNKEGSIFIAGAGGGVGSIGVQLARHFHRGDIFTIAGSEESKAKIAAYHKIPSDRIVVYQGLSMKQLQDELIKRNANELFAATFDFVGKEMKALSLELTAHSGHFVSIVPEADDSKFPLWTRGGSPYFAKNLNLHCVSVGAEAFSGPRSSWEIYQEHLGRITALIEESSLFPPPIQVIGDLGLQTVQAAHRLLAGGRVRGKLIMKVVN